MPFLSNIKAIKSLVKYFANVKKKQVKLVKNNDRKSISLFWSRYCVTEKSLTFFFSNFYCHISLLCFSTFFFFALFNKNLSSHCGCEQMVFFPFSFRFSSVKCKTNMREISYIFFSKEISRVGPSSSMWAVI